MFPAFYVPGLWLLDFTSQFAPDSPVKKKKKAFPLSYFLCCHCQGKEGRPEGCGTVTDMPHPSIQRSGNNESMLRNVYMEEKTCASQSASDYDDVGGQL